MGADWDELERRWEAATGDDRWPKRWKVLIEMVHLALSEISDPDIRARVLEHATEDEVRTRMQGALARQIRAVLSDPERELDQIELAVDLVDAGFDLGEAKGEDSAEAGQIVQARFARIVDERLDLLALATEVQIRFIRDFGIERSEGSDDD